MPSTNDKLVSKGRVAAPSPPEPQEPQRKPTNSKKKKPDINPKFKDVQETGKWGEISRTEVYIAIAFAVLVLAGAIVGVIFALQDDDDNGPVPTSPPTALDPAIKLALAFEAIDQSDFTYLYQQELPTDVEAYEGVWEDEEAAPTVRAMSWLLYQDEDWTSRDELGERWALASIYYSLGGPSWRSANKWLSSESICDWEHINCNASNLVDEIDLANNNLKGTIPNEFVMINSVEALWLRENELTGTIPNEALGSMPRLSILYLDNNKLTGTISTSIRDNGVLNSLFVQTNDLTGTWPRIFCPFNDAVPALIPRKGLDCNEIECLPESCCDAISCFYDEDDLEA